MPARSYLSRILFLGAAQMSLFFFAACDDGGPRIYTARPYRADGDCLEPYQPVALVEAHDLGSTCEPVCLRIDGQLFVSSVCQPYPDEATLEGADESPECQLALEKMAAGTFCDADVGPDT